MRAIKDSKKVKKEYKKESKIDKLIDELEHNISSKRGEALEQTALCFTKTINKFNRNLTDDHRNRFISLLRKAGEIIRKESYDAVFNREQPSTLLKQSPEESIM